MAKPTARLRALIALISGVLILGACGTSESDDPGGTSPNSASSAQDINAQDVSTLRSGGDLRIAVDALPTNYNPLQINGARVITWQLAEAILPSAFRDGADGRYQLATDFFTSAEVTSTDPQVVTYTINPDATWSNGRPLTWEDLQAQARALSGEDPAFEGYSNVGYSNIARVEKGDNDKQAVVTFAEPFAEWQGLFNLIVPKEITANADAFNTGWLTKPTITGGPFTFTSADESAKAVIVGRDDKWWGQAAPLDRVIFRALDQSGWSDALANNEIDIYPIGGNLDLYTRAQAVDGVQIRRAPERKAGQLTFNGAQGAPLADESLRKAIAQAVDPAAITEVLMGRIVENAKPVGNHILPPTDSGYTDNSSVLRHDTAAADRALDQLGWTRTGSTGPRSKDGKGLELRLIAPGTPVGTTVTGVIRDQLSARGITAKVNLVAPDQFYDRFLIPGNFDIAAFEWTKSSSPFAHDRPVFQKPNGDDAGSNFGRIYIPEIDTLYDRGLTELDLDARNKIANEIDVLAWRHAHHLPLYADSGAYAVRSGLANYGARGLGAYGFEKAGWQK